MNNDAQSLHVQEPEEMARFRAALLNGEPWHLALLDAIGRWTLPEEVIEGRRYLYLLQGEAFDWLALAERLCTGVNGLIPEDEYERLMFAGVLPVEIDDDEIRKLVGDNKYKSILNFWYGVVVEEALQLVVEEKVRKERRALGLPDSEEFCEKAFQRIYGEERTDLFGSFRKEMDYPQRRSTTLTELREFTYWLFKRRVVAYEPARVASDTRRGLARLRKLRRGKHPF